MGVSPALQRFKGALARPRVKKLKDDEPLRFMVTDVSEDSDPFKDVVHVYGVTMEGNSVFCEVSGVYVHFWARGTGRIPTSRWIRKVTREQRTLYGYLREPEEFLKVELKSKMMLRRVSQEFVDAGFQVYQHRQQDMSMEHRFCIDSNTCGYGWVEIRDPNYLLASKSKCQIEVSCSLQDYRAFTVKDGGVPGREWVTKNAPLREFVFDIECVAKRGFPTPHNSTVVQIGVYVKHGDDVLFNGLLFTGETDDIAGCDMIHCETEEDLLETFAAIAEMSDYEVDMQYNGNNFDWPYLYGRSQVLQLSADSFKGILSRHKSMPAVYSVREYKGKTFTDMHVPGRSSFDICDIVKKECTFRSYTLNNVAQEVLNGMTKEDVHHSMIKVLYWGSSADRARLGKYCQKDVVLTSLIADKQLLLLRYIEQARMCHVRLRDLTDRGEQVKALMHLAVWARDEKYVLPIRQQITNYVPAGKYEGAVVLPPTKGYHKQPIAVLDFSALYPSEGISRNICATTLLPANELDKYDEKDYYRATTGYCFVKSHVREGLLPRMWKACLAARSAVKGEKKACLKRAKELEETDPEAAERWKYEAQVQDARQLAIKKTANALYGFNGVSFDKGGMLSCFEVSSSICAAGREDLMASCARVKHYFPTATIHYGDTDSIFISHPEKKNVKEAMEWMDEVHEKVSGELFGADRWPMSLEPEKVLWPTCFFQKKKYVAGYYASTHERPDKVLYKGIEVARRDNPPVLKNCMEEVCRAIYIDRDTDKAVQLAKQVVADLYMRRIQISELMISKRLAREPHEYSTPQPHGTLVTKMRKRDPDGAPIVGDRVAYVVVGEDPNEINAGAEDPLYALEHNSPINIAYYIERQFKRPMLRILEPVIGKAASQDIFTGSHTRKRVRAQPQRNRGIARFATVQRACEMCGEKYVLKAHSHPRICSDCTTDEDTNTRHGDLRDMEDLYAKQCEVCYSCQGTRDEIVCMARDCDQLYRRKAAQHSMNAIRKELGMEPK